MKIYRIWIPYREEYSRLYLTFGAAKGAVKTGRWLSNRELLEIHEFEMYPEPNRKMNYKGEEK